MLVQLWIDPTFGAVFPALFVRHSTATCSDSISDSNHYVSGAVLMQATPSKSYTRAEWGDPTSIGRFA